MCLGSLCSSPKILASLKSMRFKYGATLANLANFFTSSSTVENSMKRLTFLQESGCFDS